MLLKIIIFIDYIQISDKQNIFINFYCMNFYAKNRAMHLIIVTIQLNINQKCHYIINNMILVQHFPTMAGHSYRY